MYNPRPNAPPAAKRDDDENNNDDSDNDDDDGDAQFWQTVLGHLITSLAIAYFD